MKRWLPHPLVSLGLALIWLVLNQSLAPAQVLAAVIVGFAGGKLLARLQMPPTRFRRPRAILLLTGRVLWDILRSNLAVASIILVPGSRHAHSAFVRIPLKMRSPYGLATLGCIITAAPGTCWVDYDSASGMLLIHVLDMVDERQWVRTVQSRYEVLLMEIFE